MISSSSSFSELWWRALLSLLVLVWVWRITQRKFGTHNFLGSSPLGCASMGAAYSRSDADYSDASAVERGRQLEHYLDVNEMLGVCLSQEIRIVFHGIGNLRSRVKRRWCGLLWIHKPLPCPLLFVWFPTDPRPLFSSAASVSCWLSRSWVFVKWGSLIALQWLNALRGVRTVPVLPPHSLACPLP